MLQIKSLDALCFLIVLSSRCQGLDLFTTLNGQFGSGRVTGSKIPDPVASLAQGCEQLAHSRYVPSSLLLLKPQGCR